MSQQNIKTRSLNGIYGGRTDVPTTIYKGKGYTHIEWRCPNGDSIRMAVLDLQHGLEGVKTRGGNGTMKGKRILFKIDSVQRTVRPDGDSRAIQIPMEIIPKVDDET
jgi:hypothetical protein